MGGAGDMLLRNFAHIKIKLWLLNLQSYGITGADTIFEQLLELWIKSTYI
jgi:hypothetical protein